METISVLVSAVEAKDASYIIKTMDQMAPLKDQSLSHLNRMRSSKTDSNKRELTVVIGNTPLQSTKIPDEVQAKLKPFAVSVPKHKPLSLEEYSEGCKLWPMRWKGGCGGKHALDLPEKHSKNERPLKKRKKKAYDFEIISTNKCTGAVAASMVSGGLQHHAEPEANIEQAEKSEETTIILFYKYVKVAEPRATVQKQHAVASRLKLLGRVLVADEGINATLAGLLETSCGVLGCCMKSPPQQDELCA
jgi:hypothetical protein